MRACLRGVCRGMRSFCELLRKSGQEGERLNVWQEGDVPEIFPEGSCKRWESVFSEEVRELRPPKSKGRLQQPGNFLPGIRCL